MKHCKVSQNIAIPNHLPQSVTTVSQHSKRAAPNLRFSSHPALGLFSPPPLPLSWSLPLQPLSLKMQTTLGLLLLFFISFSFLFFPKCIFSWSSFYSLPPPLLSSPPPPILLLLIYFFLLFIFSKIYYFLLKMDFAFLNVSNLIF